MKPSDQKNDITVVVTRYGEPDELVKTCLNSLAGQKKANVCVLFLDQKESPDIKEHTEKLSNGNVMFKYINIPAKSLSYARNYGIKESGTDLVAFCDSDCILDKTWANQILNAFILHNAAIVGTRIDPKWEEKPKWFHSSAFIREFYSVFDISQHVTEVPKIIGASFALNKRLLGEDAYFDENLGRKSGKLLGGEETDLCSRVRNKQGKIVYTPHTTALHVIASERMKFRWLVKRSFYGGYSRAARGGKAEPFNKSYKLVDRIAILTILPAYVLGYFKGVSAR